MKAKKFAKKIRKIMDTLTSDFEPANYLIFSDAYEMVADKIHDAATKLRRLSDRLEIEGRADAVAHIASYLEPMESISELMMEHHPDEWFSNAEAQAANAVMGHSFDIETPPTPPTGKWATSFFVYGPKPDPVAPPEYWGNPGVSPDTIISDIQKMLGAVSTSAIPDTMDEALFKFKESQEKLSDRINNFYSAALRKGLELRSELQAENALKMMRENTEGQSHFEAFLLSKLAKALNTDAASNTPASRPERGDAPGSKDDIAVPVIARDLKIMVDRLHHSPGHSDIVHKYRTVLKQHYALNTPPAPTDD